MNSNPNGLHSRQFNEEITSVNYTAGIVIHHARAIRVEITYASDYNCSSSGYRSTSIVIMMLAYFYYREQCHQYSSHWFVKQGSH